MVAVWKRVHIRAVVIDHAYYTRVNIIPDSQPQAEWHYHCQWHRLLFALTYIFTFHSFHII